MTVGHRVTWPRGVGWLVAAALVIVAVVALASAAYVIQSNAGAASGVQNGSAFLTHWQQTGVQSTTTPTPAPTAASTVAGTPTRLPGAGASYRLNPATPGDPAVEWVFTESTGIGTDLEVEVAYNVQYTLNGVAETASGTVYLESQATALAANLVFDLYWDSGATTGVALGIESEISQACSAVGSCP
jgi:hypothetical protein